jgi:hypothetical protein
MASHIVRRAALIAVLMLATGASAQTLTVMQLLQNPRQFVGRRVTVTGYYAGDWEGHLLYAGSSERDKTMERSLFVYAEPRVDSRLRKALVIGVFVYDFRATGHILGGGYGPYGGWKGALENAVVRFPRERKASN